MHLRIGLNNTFFYLNTKRKVKVDIYISFTDIRESPN